MQNIIIKLLKNLTDKYTNTMGKYIVVIIMKNMDMVPATNHSHTFISSMISRRE